MKANLIQIITARYHFCLHLFVSLRNLCTTDSNLLSINVKYSLNVNMALERRVTALQSAPLLSYAQYLYQIHIP